MLAEGSEMRLTEASVWGRCEAFMEYFSAQVINENLFSDSYQPELGWFSHLHRAAQSPLDVWPTIMRAISASFVLVLQQLHSPINILMIDDN